MGLLDLASGNSYFRGYYYFKEGRVKEYRQEGTKQYTGVVDGSESNEYEVCLDLEHPKKSTCTCPHADGTRRVCKHKVALYFTLFPEEAEEAERLIREWEEEQERKEADEYNRIVEYVESLSEEQLKEELIEYMVRDKELY